MSERHLPLELEELTVRYGRTEAVRRVSLTVEPGSIYALLGRNGAGKSSLVRSAIGLQRPNGGRARIFGLDSWKKRLPCTRRIAFVPERPDAPPRLTAPQIVRFCASFDKRLDREMATMRLGRFKTPPKTPFSDLSRGQQAQVQLTLALSVRPELLVLDDPTLGLDTVAKKAFYDELIDELAERQVTVFLTTHDLSAVERIADRIAILQEGTLLVDEDLDDLKQRFRRITPRTPESRTLLSQLRQVPTNETGWGEELIVSDFSEDQYPELTSANNSEVATLSLDEIFQSVTASEERKAS